MKAFLLLWALPVSFLGLWYGLSSNDLHFGIGFFSRRTHDLVFAIYADVLGIAPEAIPPLVAKAILVDTGLVLAFLAFRRRRQIVAFARRRLNRRGLAATPADPAHPAG